MIVTHELRHLENIHVVDHAGHEYFGCDQNWYSSEWQQMSGCGPSTASTLLLYLQKSGRIDLPVHVFEQKDCKLLMEAVWTHVTPTQDGIYLIEQFCDGIQSFARSHGFSLDCQALNIPERTSLRPELTDVISFIAYGLDQDCPVAFLNLSSGEVNNLEAWHWVTIVGLETDERQDQVFVTIFDGDKSDKIDFKRWYQTTIDGGALIFLDRVSPDKFDI